MISSHVQATQIGVIKSGYEVSFYAMRKLINKAKRSGEVSILLGFENAYNTVNRILMLRLTGAHYPEFTNIALWQYELEPPLIKSGGDSVKSSTGTKQRCTL